MNLPIRAFWFLNGNIVKLMAEKDMRAMLVGASVYSDESYTQTRNHLEMELGRVIEHEFTADVERDNTAFEELRAISKVMI